jgi:HD-GYP domain-containing protein (c-di-GMP phosphodiesterase class II)
VTKPMGTATTLSRSLATHDPSEAAHAIRVTTLALRLAEAVDAAPGAVEAIRIGGPLHDVGKLSVRTAVLAKPGPLDDDELAEIRAHPAAGAEMVSGVHSLRGAVPCVLHHHERWDGAGYPNQLRGPEIPLEARILALADAYDAMTMTRPYRVALSHDDAVREVERCSGSQFDPELTIAFLRLGNSS